MRRLMLVLVLGLAAIVAVGLFAMPGFGARPSAGLMPDLRTVVPGHIQLVNQGQQEIVRFSNGIANTGAGPWAVRPEPPPGTDTLVTTAVQEIRDSGALYKCGTQPKQVSACFNVVDEIATGTFEYHPTHNHWHIGGVALFEVRRGAVDGPLVGDSLKTGFCLLDLVKLDGNAPTSEKVFWDCYTSYQGISAGWVDQYHQATDGQQVNITGTPDGDYYLVSTSNSDRTFREASYTNNTAWARFRLFHDSNGNRKLEVTDYSPCDSPGLCGEYSPNR